MPFVKSEGKTRKTSVTLSDEELWLTFSKGDDSAYTLLYFRYADRVYSYLRLLLGSGQERNNVEDVFQETWIRVYRAKEKFEIRDIGTFSGWLFRIAHNFAISVLRRPNHVSLYNDLVDDRILNNFSSTITQDTLSDHQSAEEVLRILRSIVEALPLSLKEVYLLSEFERMSMEQVSQTLTISIANAKVRLFRARKVVREKMIEILGIEKTFLTGNDHHFDEEN